MDMYLLRDKAFVPRKELFMKKKKMIFPVPNATEMEVQSSELSDKNIKFLNEEGKPDNSWLFGMLFWLANVKKMDLDLLYQLARTLNQEMFNNMIPDAYLRKKVVECFYFKTTNNQTFCASFEGLIDIVLDQNGQTQYLIIEENQQMQLAPYMIDGADLSRTFLAPPPKKCLPWELPHFENILNFFDTDSDQSLFDDLKVYVDSNVDLGNPSYSTVLVLFIMLSYLTEQIQIAPSLFFYGSPGTGKTTILKVLRSLCFRPLFLCALNEAPIFRSADRANVTLILDISDVQAQASKQNSYEMLLNRMDRSAITAKVLNPDAGPFLDTTYFKNFGLTVLASNEPLQEALMTRVISIPPFFSKKIFNHYITAEDGKEFRDRLTAFRARHLQKPLPNISKMDGTRWSDILRPLIQVSLLLSPQVNIQLQEAMKILNTHRSSSLKETFEYELLLSILSAFLWFIQNPKYRHSPKILLEVKDIYDRINSGMPEYEKYSFQKIGRTIQKLRIPTVRAEGNRAHVLWDKTYMAALYRKYEIVVPENCKSGSDVQYL